MFTVMLAQEFLLGFDWVRPNLRSVCTEGTAS